MDSFVYNIPTLRNGLHFYFTSTFFYRVWDRIGKKCNSYIYSSDIFRVYCQDGRYWIWKYDVILYKVYLDFKFKKKKVIFNLYIFVSNSIYPKIKIKLY